MRRLCPMAKLLILLMLRFAMMGAGSADTQAVDSEQPAPSRTRHGFSYSPICQFEAEMMIHVT